MKQPVIIAAKRIAFGKYGGRLKHLEPGTKWRWNNIYCRWC